MQSAARTRSVPESDPVAGRARLTYRRPRRLPMERIVTDCDAVIDIAAIMFDVSGRELRQSGRASTAVCRVRQIAMYVAHVALGYSMRQVGDGFGRDRTTVLHACHQIEDMRDDLEFDAMVLALERVVRAAAQLTGPDRP